MVKSRAKVSAQVSVGTAIALRQALAGDELFLGFGAATAKSVELVCVSVQPSVLRASAVAFDGGGAAVADEVDDAGAVWTTTAECRCSSNERDLSSSCSQVDCAIHIRCWKP